MYVPLGYRFETLPKGLSEDELLIITSQFKVGDLSNREKFILAYTRLVIQKALSFIRNTNHADDIINVALMALSEVPGEVQSKLIDFNIIGYTLSRVRTKVIDYIRKDYVIACDHRYLELKLTQCPMGRVDTKNTHLLDESINNVSMNEPVVDERSLKDLRETIYSCVKTDLDKIVLTYLEQGYTQREISKILGCSTTKINVTIKALEERFENSN